MEYTIDRLTAENWKDRQEAVNVLVRAYSIDFWSTTWCELLAVRDENDQVVSQYGTWDENSQVFLETHFLLDLLGLSIYDSSWPEKLWEHAGKSKLFSANGQLITQYWSLERSHDELYKFVAPVHQDGYGGEILVLMSEAGEVAGFSALTCLAGDVGRKVAHARYPSTLLHIPVDSDQVTNVTIHQQLTQMYPDELRFGVFLDHAISVNHRGGGLGSRLFDARLDRLSELGVEVLFGRTQITAHRQYFGNYLARGLRPFAADVKDRDKHYFTAHVHDLTARKSKRSSV